MIIVGTITDQTIKLPDNRILAFKMYGKPPGVPTLFIHGFGSSAAAIDPDLEWLERHNVYILAVQRPGYGDSHLKAGYTMSDFAHDIKTLIDELRIEKVALIGWSAGGLFSQVFAHLYPKNVASLSLVSSAIPFNSVQTKNILPANWKLIKAMNRYFPSFSKRFFKKLSQKIVHQLDRTMDQSLREMVEADRRVAIQPAIMAKITRGAQEAYQNDGLAVYYDAQAMTERMEFTTGPTPFNVFIWQGVQDRVWTMRTSEHLSSRYENSQLQVIEGQGHLLYLSHWNEILKKAIQP